MPEGQGMAGLPTLHPNAEHRACAHVGLQTLLDNNAVSEKSGQRGSCPYSKVKKADARTR